MLQLSNFAFPWQFLSCLSSFFSWKVTCLGPCPLVRETWKVTYTDGNSSCSRLQIGPFLACEHSCLNTAVSSGFWPIGLFHGIDNYWLFALDSYHLHLTFLTFCVSFVNNSRRNILLHWPIRAPNQILDRLYAISMAFLAVRCGHLSRETSLVARSKGKHLLPSWTMQPSQN